MTASWQTPVADANYVAKTTDLSIVYTSLTAARTVTLPPVAQYPQMVRLVVADYSGNCSATDTITLEGDALINGEGTFVIKAAYASVDIWTTDGATWTVIAQSLPVLGTMAPQNANAVAITGGAIAGAAISGGTIQNAAISGASTTIQNAAISGASTTIEGATISGCNIENASAQGIWGGVSISNFSSLKSSGNGIYITPNNSGKVVVNFSGSVSESSGSVAVNLLAQLYYGTGTKPGSGGTGGTAIGANVTVNAATASGVPLQAILTGLTEGTLYWIDLFCAESVNTNPLSVTGVLSAFEF